jgi:NADPH:quinone reductase
MRRVRYYEHGDPGVLRIEDVPVPAAADGQVLIRTEAVGTSYVDTAFRRGDNVLGQASLPGSPHGDVVGTVEAVGPGVDGTLTGQRVAALVASDAYADYVVADAHWLARVPAGVEPGVASVLDMPAPVALGLLRAGRLAPGETVLVHSAAGGVGHLATQLAKLAGAGLVIGTASAPGKLEFTRRHGADLAVCYTDPDWTEQVRTATPGGVDVILDSVGGQVNSASLDLLAPLGRLVIYGAGSGELPALPATKLYALKSVTGFALLAWRAARPELARRDIEEVIGHAAAGRLQVAVQATVPLAEVAKAHELLEDRNRLGRVLLVP